MTVAIYIVFVLLLVFFAAMLAAICKTKSFFSKKNALFFFPLVAFSIVLYSFGYAYANGSYDGISFFECITAAIKSFKFDVKREYIQLLLENNVVYAISIYLTTVLCGLTTVTTILGFCEVFLVNSAKLFYRIFHKTPDFVIGSSPEALKFAGNNKNAVLLVNKEGKEPLTADKRKSLYVKNVVYLRMPFSTEKLLKLLSYTRGKVHVFCFDNSVETIDTVTQWIKSVKLPAGQTVEFHLDVSEANVLYVNKRLTEACACTDGEVTLASCFNLYRIIGQKFSQQYNFAEFLPESFLKEGTIDPEKNVHAVFLGAGKTNTSVMEFTVLNNQFAYLKDGKYAVKPILYHVYDKNAESFDSKIVNALSKERKEGLAAITLTERLNLKSGFSLGDEGTRSLPKPDENTFVYYFVNVGDTLDNLTLVNALTEQISVKNAVAFYNVDSKKEVVAFNTPVKVLPYGFKDEIMTKENIVEAELFEKAMDINELYNKQKKEGEPFTTLNIVEKLSNLYADVNVEFKLNLLGLTTKQEKGEKQVSKEEYYDRYYGGQVNPVRSYEDYFKICPANAIRYQEHVRWWTYYYVNDFRPMDTKSIGCNPEKNKMFHKDLTNKLHACCVSFYDLDEVHRYEAKLLSEAKAKIGVSMSEEEALDTVETYKYDGQILETIIEKQPVYLLKR